MAVLDRMGFERMMKSGRKPQVTLICSPDPYLLESCAGRLLKALSEAEGEEPTVLPGPVPDMGEVVASVGAISLFGTKRLVYLNGIDPAEMPKKDMELLAELAEECDSAYLVITILLKSAEQRGGKKAEPKIPAAAKALASAAEKFGVSALIESVNEGSAAKFAENCAKEANTEFGPGASKELIDRCGTDLYRIGSETAKLASASGYTTITIDLVKELVRSNVEADVFEMLDALFRGKSKEAFSRLDRLLYLRTDPISISGAMASSIVNMARVKAAVSAKVSVQQAAESLKASSWMFERSYRTAKNFSDAQLKKMVLIMDRLDNGLKGSAQDKTVYMQQILGELLLVCREKK